MNGQGFCCNDGTPEAAQARAMARTRTANDNFHDKDNYEKLQFYYHPDHLGSSSYITNLDGEVAQHIEYVPFGEVFIEERNNTWNTPYLFNAKEFDEETGMYYYGARYYEPRLSLWMSTDPMQEKYPNITSYCYTFDNPIKYIDPQGLENVVVVGNQGNSPKSDRTCILRIDKRHFLEAGLHEAIKLKSQPFNLNEPTTMIVYHGNYSNEELKYYESRAKKEGIRFLIANNADEIINYINNGDMRNFISSGKRISEKEKITDFSYIGHGWKEALFTGYNAIEEGSDFDALYTKKLQTSAFSVNCNVYLNACGSGFDVMDDFVNRIVGGTVVGYRVTVIWGEKGIGRSRPYEKWYYPPGDPRRSSSSRMTVPVNQRTRIEKGKRKK